MLQVKICGMRENANIKAVAELNPNFMGFIFYPKSKRYVGESFDNEIIYSLPSNIETVAVFVNETHEKVLEISKKFQFAYVQLHGSETPEYCNKLKMKGIKILKAFGVHAAFDWSRLIEYQQVCDYFLFDTSSADYGGTGLKFDWSILSNYNPQKPFFLSGGIGSDDANTVLSLNYPYLAGIDINSKFEISPAIKDVNLLTEFLNKVKTIN